MWLHVQANVNIVGHRCQSNNLIFEGWEHPGAGAL